MEWKKFTIATRSEAEEIITGILTEMGIYSVEIEDKVPLTDEEKAQMFVDIAPDRHDDGLASVSFYLEEGEDAHGILSELRRRIEQYRAHAGTADYVDIGDCTIATSDTEDQDWINNWKQHFSRFYIDDILFIPTWECEGKTDDELRKEAEEETGSRPRLLIRTDPGMAFGTGKHETTMLCIKELNRVINVGDRVLDVGTGSGILSLMALRFGAGEVFATDLDQAALTACSDNFEKNHIQDPPFTLRIGNIIEDGALRDEIGYERYDVAVANILAEVLIPMMAPVYAALKRGGTVITSGIIEGREDDVIRAMEEAGFLHAEVKSMGEWRLVTARK